VRFKNSGRGENMTEFNKSQDDFLFDHSIPVDAIPLESVLCTEELHRRPCRAPDYEEENRALVKLATALADSPSTIFRTLTDTIRAVTQCDTAGLSLLTNDGKTPHADGKRFYWAAISGMWNSHAGGGTPRNFGPSGEVLDQNRTLLFTHFERRYPYLTRLSPVAEECLLVPFHVAGKAVGTIWAIMHSDHRRFDAEDARVMDSLGKFASSARQALARIEQAREKAQSELTRVARVVSLGTLVASIAHEISQPLSSIVINANTCQRMLVATPPNIDGALETAHRTVRDAKRASEVITRLRALFRGEATVTESVDLNEATREVIELSMGGLRGNRLIVQTELAEDLKPVTADRVQLQQVILNLLQNAVEAMSTVDDRQRELLIKTELCEEDHVCFSVKDTGVGLPARAAEELFQAFFTTKNDGMGIGLSVSRSIIESHRGRLWAVKNDGPGSTFSFSIPCRREVGLSRNEGNLVASTPFGREGL
jgi:signal transduction histidine kinase